MRTLWTGACTFIFLIGMFFLVNSCSKKNDVESPIINPTVHPIPFSVMVYLITPTDQSFNPQYYIGLKASVLRLQTWYKTQMGNNKTFVLNPVAVDTLSGLHNSGWYDSYHADSISGTSSIYAYYNTFYELQQLLGENFDTTHFTYFVYIPADFRDETIPKRLAVEGLANLQGISGDNPDSWIGAAGHALGHAFGLPEPEIVNSQAIMSTGYPNYPHCIFTPAEKDTLNASPFFQIQ